MTMETQLILDDIVSTLRANNLKPSGKGSTWMSFCPLHDDVNNRALSVGIGDKGNILLHCFAQCSSYQELKKWLTAKGVNFPKKESAPDSDNQVWKYITVEPWGVFPFKWDKDKAEPIFEHLYVYRRKDGTPYAFKMRFTPKDFRRFRLEGGKIKPSWRGLKMDPYNWDIACKAAAEGKPIVCVEGEKDSDTVVQELEYASLSVGGVSDHWDESWNEHLKGTKGLIWVADNDLVKGNKKEPGLKKATEQCELTHKHFPVKLVMFNNHKDTTDWRKAGGTPEDFAKKIKDTKRWEIPAHKAPLVVPEFAPVAPERSPAGAGAVVEVKDNGKRMDWGNYPFAPCTDSANAVRLLKNRGKEIRYVPKEKQWYAFNGKFWEPDHGDKVQEYCKEISKRIFAEELPVADYAIRTELDKWAKDCQDMSRIRAAKAAAASIPQLQAPIESFDSRETRRLFNCKSGVLDFDSGIVHPHSPDFLITHYSNIEYVPEIPQKWLENTFRIFGGDKQMIEYFHLYVGYCFTGETYFQRYGIFHGPENTGKSFYPNTFELVMGSYYGTIDMQTLCEVDQRSAGADSDLDATRGKRLIVGHEMKANQKLDEQVIKALTGGDTLRTKLMGQNKKDLKGCAKLVFTGNERARVNPTGSIQRRMLTFPMSQPLQEKDFIDDYHRIVAQEEGGMILHWAMLHARQASLKALAVLPDATKRENADYMREVNLPAQWKLERAKKLNGSELTVTEAFEDFVSYCQRQRMRPWVKPTFIKALQMEGMFSEPNHIKVSVYKDFALGAG